MNQYPKRLIEVDLPIKRISAHARREKSIRHGHISTLHIWWARRPLASCRAVICAALWPDPADPLCPQAFRKAAAKEMIAFAKAVYEATDLSTICDGGAWKRYGVLAKRKTPLDLKTLPIPRKNGDSKPKNPTDLEQLRELLLDFIADASAWEATTNKIFIQTARNLTQAAHEALGGATGTRPLVVDPFCGGGSIPFEALRVGADAIASDLNPIPVLLNKVVLEYIPKYGQRLADEVRKWGEWIKREAEKELAEFYPKDEDGTTPIAYLWARTIQCEGPGCGAEVPLIRSLWLAKKANRSVALQLVPNKKATRVDFQIIVKQRDGWVDQANPKTKIEDPKFDGTVKRGSATCPCCGYTTPVARVREQFRARYGGANDAMPMCVALTTEGEQGRSYRLPSKLDLEATKRAVIELESRERESDSALSMVPNEPLPPQGTLGFRVQLYGMLEWGNLFSARQLLALTTLARLVREAGKQIRAKSDAGFAEALQAILGLTLSRGTDLNNSLCAWKPDAECPVHLFGRQAIPVIWDFAEAVLTSESSGSWDIMVSRTLDSLASLIGNETLGQAQQADASANPLPDDSAQAFFTDPPYYDAVPYSDLSDFFFVWLKRVLPEFHANTKLTPKEHECIVDEVKGKDRRYFEAKMQKAMVEGRRVLAPSGIGIVVFAHKSTGGWEAQLQAMINAGWITTASWPVDTECGSRLRAMDSAALASSVHLVCRPRENPDGSVRTDEIGDWRDVLQELPRRIHEWMPRLAEEGVAGADAIFACLGPALEIFSRHSRVEKSNGEPVALKTYLEHVWAAVAQEALRLVFEGADASGFEEDARLTAMWLWTLFGGTTGNDLKQESVEESDEEEDEGAGSKKTAKGAGFVLEYDAARKIAQGLGAHLEELTSVIEVHGDTARLLAVAERTRKLFGKDEADAPGGKKRKNKSNQAELFGSIDEIEAEEGGWGEKGVPKLGETVLDRVHQSMILFAAGRSEAIKRFLVEEGVGRDGRFWKLAQALSALYPPGTDEKRWVDGVLARKKGLGF